MPLLRSLHVMGRKHEVLRMDALKFFLSSLGRLRLFWKLQKIPEWVDTLPKLRELWLGWSSLEKNPASNLAAFCNLRILCLIKAYNGKSMDFLEGFGKLENLFLCNSSELETITTIEGVMPSL
ncbi:conserved hypothetical protein [Ricinus communis]|uniref:Uncharacterized protein n=1 Tax=Ricinus communis TaxID=3988 RepID=B9SKA0_RICCO|nr:conserved hypothetical protein [Ricinus communis]